MALPILFAVPLTLAAVAHAAEAPRATYDEPTGRVTITEAGKTVLVYHYKNVPVPAEFSGAKKRKKHAIARSNYIHPMCGLDGIPLTSDWNEDHPHHRGIYWAWPEVCYYNETADLHALQRVWARPTGKIETRSGDGWVEIEAKNRWMWEDKTPIVHETAVIRAWQAGVQGRWIDLTLRFKALEDVAKPGKPRVFHPLVDTLECGDRLGRFTAFQSARMRYLKSQAAENPIIRAVWLGRLGPGSKADPSRKAVKRTLSDHRSPRPSGNWIPAPHSQWPLIPRFNSIFQEPRDLLGGAEGWKTLGTKVNDLILLTLFIDDQ